MKRFIEQRSSTFLKILWPLINNQSPSKSKPPNLNTYTGSDDSVFDWKDL